MADPSVRTHSIAHAVRKIREIALRPEADRLGLFQLGYNLGRLSELTGRGREPYWDRWKAAVATWDARALRELAVELDLEHEGEGGLSSSAVPEGTGGGSHRN